MSGVYIRGMEMPTNCAECKMYVEDIYCCHLLHRQIENPWADDGVETDCPLIPVPDHGRLVCDREVKWAFDDAIMNEAQQTGKVRATSDEIAKIISSVPTIIQAEEDE